MYERRKGRRVIALALGACAVTAITGCASAAGYNPSNLAPAQLGQINAICRSVMGLPDAYDADHAACVTSLSDSFKARLRAERLASVRQDCRAQGLHRGTTALSACELAPGTQVGSLSGARAGSRAEALARQPVLQAALPAPPAKSYFSASFDQVRRREQRACADIGYDPVSGGGFNQCVAQLSANLTYADDPMN